MSNLFQRKSDAYWAEGEACVEEGCWNSAAHSLYYAVFQAVFGYAEGSGILQIYTKPYIDPYDSRERIPSKHDAVRKIVRKWKGEQGFQVLKGLYAARIAADYKAEDVTGPQVTPHMRAADAIRQYFINLKTIPTENLKNE